MRAEIRRVFPLYLATEQDARRARMAMAFIQGSAASESLITSLKESLLASDEMGGDFVLCISPIIRAMIAAAEAEMVEPKRAAALSRRVEGCVKESLQYSSCHAWWPGGWDQPALIEVTQHPMTGDYSICATGSGTG